eukprot:3084248-Rhodomonas_salina.1
MPALLLHQLSRHRTAPAPHHRISYRTSHSKCEISQPRTSQSEGMGRYPPCQYRTYLARGTMLYAVPGIIYQVRMPMLYAGTGVHIASA